MTKIQKLIASTRLVTPENAPPHSITRMLVLPARFFRGLGFAMVKEIFKSG
jgi:hypothetical protein